MSFTGVTHGCQAFPVCPGSRRIWARCRESRCTKDQDGPGSLFETGLSSLWTREDCHLSVSHPAPLSKLHGALQA